MAIKQRPCPFLPDATTAPDSYAWGYRALANLLTLEESRARVCLDYQPPSVVTTDSLLTHVIYLNQEKQLRNTGVRDAMNFGALYRSPWPFLNKIY